MFLPLVFLFCFFPFRVPISPICPSPLFYLRLPTIPFPPPPNGTFPLPSLAPALPLPPTPAPLTDEQVRQGMGQEAGEGREDVASAGQQVRRERLLPLVELEDFQGEARAVQACPGKIACKYASRRRANMDFSHTHT